MRTLSRMDGFEMRGAGAFHAYLRQAVMNRLRDELRRKGRVPQRQALLEGRYGGREWYGWFGKHDALVE